VRILPSFAKTLLILLLALVLGGYLAWQARHQWLPPVASWWLDGAEIQQLEGLKLAAGGRELSLQGLTLILGERLQLELREVRVSGWMGLAGLSDKPAAIDIQKITISDLPAPIDSTPQTRAEGSGKTATKNGAASHSDASSDTPAPSPQTADNTDAEPGTLSKLLPQLRELKLQAVRIHDLRWQDQFTGGLKIDITRQDDILNGVATHHTCAECQLHFKLHNLPDRLSLESTLGAPSTSAPRAVLRLSKIPPVTANSPIRWNAELSLQTATAPAIKVMENWTRITAKPTYTEAPADIVSGKISLSATAELPDKLQQLDQVANVAAALSANNIHVLLPPSISGLAQPLHLVANSTHTIELDLSSLHPLRVNSVIGNISLILDPAEDRTTNIGADIEPLVQADLTLSSDKISTVSLQGALNLERMNGIIPAHRVEALLGGHTLQNLNGNLHLTGKADLPSPQNVLQQANYSAGNIRVQLQSGGEISAQIVPQTEQSPLKTLGWHMPRVSLKLNEAVSLRATAWPGPLQLSTQALSLSVEDQADSAGAPRPPEQTLSATLSNVSCDNLLTANCQMNIDGSLSGVELPGGLRGKDLKLALRAKLGAEGGKTIAAPDRVTLRDINLAAKELVANEITFGQPELFAQSVLCNWQSDRLKCGTPQAAISLSPMTLPGNHLSGVIYLDYLTFHGTTKKEPISIDAGFRSDSLAIATGRTIELELSSSGRFHLQGGLLTGSSKVQIGDIALNSEWRHDLESAQGQLSVNLPETRFSTGKTLSQIVKGLPINIVDGSVTANMRLNWPEDHKSQPVDRIHLRLNSVSATYGDIVAVGISSDLTLISSGEQWITENTRPVTIQRVDAGVPIDNLHFEVSLAYNQDLRLSGFSGELLKGALTADALVWNLNGAERHSELAFTGISLNTLAKEMESENFAASGLLDARLPITTDRQGITIENGTLDARAPGGRLRYYGAFSPSMLTSNPQLKLIAGALEDYNYREIHGTINYPLSGDLKLNLKLTGRSEAVDANRDLVINLNLENNVPSMLKSLQASRNLTDVLENAVQ